MEATFKQVRRIGLIVTGIVLLAVGLVMLVLPGPGALCIVAGLTLLAREFMWAQRALGQVKAVVRYGAELLARGVRLLPRLKLSSLFVDR